MTQIDQFESVFRAAYKEQFQLRDIDIRKVLVVSDLEGDAIATFTKEARSFLSVLEERDQPEFIPCPGASYDRTTALLERVAQMKPDLICTYRNLKSEAWQFPHSLGEYLDVLAQKTEVPVLVLPHPRGEDGRIPGDTNEVMAMTDNLAGEHRLVNYAAHFTAQNGTLFLAHIEDESYFERFLGVISKIPEIPTDVARERILQQLLKEPRDYIASCTKVLGDAKEHIKVEPMVSLGHRLNHYREAVAAHDVDLVVMNTKHDDHYAMHGMAYPLAVELRGTPLLML
ncbi:hypothetical protein SCOR_05025 [Sulfidibacter corallicola]|uniref:Uncharacterized protein n=1 Tax=Sulfidibacter corallicola TaxID=2818388 RepID=A0A8A4TRR2_SULCO|nr:hypothetical protein [Sulfidibacter corallicola]QTD51864.1 hypothetical protein J3U87_05280 [Sulfidibacter corallicola]